MTYTIKIDNTENKQAKNLLVYLKNLAESDAYSFLHIIEEENYLTQEQELELERRYKYVLENPEVGKTWEEIEQKLLSKNK